MCREKISFKFKMFFCITTLLLMLSIVYLCVIIYNQNSYYPTVNNGRVLTNSTKIKIEAAAKANDYKKNIKSDFKYTAVNLNGKVLMSSIKSYPKNNNIDLYDFTEYDSKFYKQNKDTIKYTEPLIVNNNEVGTVIFLIPKKYFLKTSPFYKTLFEILPIIAASIIIIIFFVYISLVVKKDILEPINSLDKSAKNILKGDFSCKIKYDYDNEIGAFCHDFEAMRDELKFSKEKEVEIKRNEKELLACISHDIKTPLTAIHGYVSGIKDGIVKDREGIENYCTVILRRVKILTKLLEDILEHSKAELNKMNIVMEEFYCGDFFRDILEDLSIEVESKGLRFEMLDEIPNLLLKADKKRISEVIYNLISNSIKYSKESSMIGVYFEVTMNYLKVYVKDTGIGIASSDVPYIFNKFYRGEKSRNQNIQGSGLGLSISKYIVEAHGGFMECIESSVRGTTMSFSLPI
ncbi:HAMP domain-containing sensor histidine kinase [Clostridium hydrogenum]|uniref:HAMP domain-containing sensor histidine kinase n=1 Tax=Clostridium hydrogenum TaxID=2855764 RepID=UPI001F2752B4|nr:HAMP domain-containing sensor histidine kinase [Clostridium hydrogenum]